MSHDEPLSSRRPQIEGTLGGDGDSETSRATPAVTRLEQHRARRALERAVPDRCAIPSGDPLVDTVRRVVRVELVEFGRMLSELAAARDDVLTMAEAAKLFRVSTKTLLDWIRQHGVPASQIGTQWRFRRSELVLWIGRQKHVQ